MSRRLSWPGSGMASESGLRPSEDAVEADEAVLETHSRARWIWGRVTAHPAVVFPAVVLCIFVILTSLGWSGTSVGVAEPGSPSLIAGTPRPIRGDEWNIATPLIVAQSHHGYPTSTPDSIGSHSVNVILDVPNRNWATIFRPWDWGAFGLDVEHTFAFRWWMLSVVLLLGAYALILRLTDRVAVSAAFSVALWASPFFHWWYLDISLASAGMGLAALAAFLAGLEQPTRLRRVAGFVVCGWAIVSFALVLYPPFQVPVAITVALIGVGHLWGTSSSVREAVRAAGAPVAAVLGGALVVLGLYYLDNRTAIHLVANTLYPGQRRNTGGYPHLYQLLSAPFGVQIANRGAYLTEGNPSDLSSFVNQSEISSFIIVAPYVCLLLYRVRLSGIPRPRRWQLTGALAAMAVIWTWYLVGLPAFLARITGLDRVPPYRAIGGVGISALLVTALVAVALSERSPDAPRSAGSSRLSRTRHSRRRRSAPDVAGAVAAAFVAFVVTFWSGRMIHTAFPVLRIGTHGELAAGLAVALAVLLLSCGWPLIGGTALAAIGVIVSLPANPLYSGLAPYTTPSVTGVLTSVPGAQSAGWLAFANPPQTSELIATGLRTVNAVDFYPNPQAWAILDPTGADRTVWDRYASLAFVDSPGLQRARLTLLRADGVAILIDPCGSQARRLGIGFVMSVKPLVEGCLAPVKSVKLLGTEVYIYRATPR